jgi:hypothetical protein
VLCGGAFNRCRKQISGPRLSKKKHGLVRWPTHISPINATNGTWIFQCIRCARFGLSSDLIRRIAEREPGRNGQASRTGAYGKSSHTSSSGQMALESCQMVSPWADELLFAVAKTTVSSRLWHGQTLSQVVLSNGIDKLVPPGW